MLRYLILLLATAVLQVSSFLALHAQSFTETHEGFFKPASLGHTSWCDVNRDGFADLFLSGFNLVPNDLGGYKDFDHSIIYINDKQGSFTESGITNIPRLIYGSSDWGDFNNDGWADVIMTGTISGFASDGQMQLYINNEGTTFTRMNLPISEITDGKTVWVDYDNDGWQDLFIIGFDQSGTLISRIFQNQKGIAFRDSEIEIDVIEAGRTNFSGIDVIVGDFDNDMDRDIIFAQTSSGGLAVDLYENTGKTLVKREANLPQVGYGTLAIADFNADGYFDIVVNGTAEWSVSETYINKASFSVLVGDGNLNFSMLKSFTNQGSYWGSVSAGDINNDGFPDIVLNGTGNGSARTSIYLNSHGNDFTLVDAGLLGTLFGEATLSDYDNDGDLDIFVIGSTTGNSSDAQARLYNNLSSVANQKPSVPQNVHVVYESGGLKMVWDRSTDDKTNPKSISYNVRIGTQLEGGEIISGLANASGSRQVDAHGNTGLSNALQLTETSEQFYFQVQAIDAALYESDFSAIQTGCIVGPPVVTYKDNYCYNEQIELTTSGSDIEIYGDEELKTVIYSGSRFIADAIAPKTFYVVQANTNGCFRIPAVVGINVGEQPQLQLMVDDEPIAAGDTIVLARCFLDQSFKIGIQTNYSHIDLWTAEANGDIIYLDNPTMLNINVQDDLGCAAQAMILVEIINYSTGFIPNVITPNDDGKNDFFVIDDFSGTEVSIFNRYGKTVYHSGNYNGEFDGRSLAPGVYYYHVNISACDDVRKGSLHIIH